MCNKHLLGEHGEMHKFLPSFRKGHKVDGRFNPVVQIQFRGYIERHDALAEEMIRRGMNHKSPLKDVPDFKKIYPQYYNRIVNTFKSHEDLIERCEECEERIFNNAPI
jgi:hypothetical protein